MKILIRNARLIDPASQTDRVADVAVAAGRILAIGDIPVDFHPNHSHDATGLWLLPGLVDLCARTREPGHEYEGMLASELAAAVAGGVTSLVCPPDTDPVLDEPGLVEMLRFRAEKLHQARLYPLGALTRDLKGQVLTEMNELTQAGCVGFGQADQAVYDTQVLQRALQYAATFGYTVWLRPQDPHLGQGVAASGPLATRMGLSGVPVAAETIALHTLFALMRSTGARVHLCRLSSASGVELVRQAKAEGLPLSCDVSINSLHLTDVDMGYFDSRARLTPPLRQQADRQALRAALADGTIDALVSDHHPVQGDEKALPFAEAEPGATGLELLLSLTLKWAQDEGLSQLQALSAVTSRPAAILRRSHPGVTAGVGCLQVGGEADLCLVQPDEVGALDPAQLRSQGRHTPFAMDCTGMSMPARVTATMVGGAWARPPRP
ncbi:MAG: dihydroorotase [Alphaproteobacteria bacterium]|nr:dihydroorotase [Alphaproteobacteria bacterium]